MIASQTIPDLHRVKVKEFTLSLAQSAGTYDVCTAGGGNILVLSVVPYNDTAAGGITSVALATNDTTPITLMAASLLAALTGGVNLTPYTTPFTLKSGKKIQGTIVGTGNAGNLKIAIRYMSLTAGADIT